MKKLGFHTLSAIPYTDLDKNIRPLSPPIIQATTFSASSSKEHGELFRNGDDRFYLRFGNQTNNLLAAKVAMLEEAEAALAFPTGMSAISTTLFSLLSAGDHVVAQRDLFAQTYTLLVERGQALGITTTFVDTSDPQHVQAAIRENTALILIETPSNPLLKIADIAAISAIGRAKRIPVLVDSTFASPFVQKPVRLGASLALHSGTKFFGGHSDVMCGFVVGGAAMIEAIRRNQMLFGSISDPHASWLILRSIRTLGIRVERQCSNALAIAEYLEMQKQVVEVRYPFLKSCPFYAVSKRQMTGGGGVLSFEVEGGLDGARALLDELELIPTATSLGGIQTVAEIPYELDFSAQRIGDKHQKDIDIRPGLIRLSVGIENISDLLEDLALGLRAIR